MLLWLGMAAQPMARIPFVRNYSASDYNAQVRNWSILRDNRGILYIGNNRNLLTFDGNHWRKIRINNTIVRSLALGSDHRVYAGAQGDFGYLAPDTIGNLRFVSMAGIIPEADRKFSDVYSLHTSGDTLYVHTMFRVFRIHGRQVESWKTNSSYHRSFLIDGRYYLIQERIGLMRLEKDGFKLVTGGNRFNNFDLLSMMVRLQNGKILLGIQRSGLFLYDPKESDPRNAIVEFQNEVQDYLAENGLFCSASLPDGNIAIGTLTGGFVIINQQGKLVMRFDEPQGLQSEMSLAMCIDGSNNLVVANNGISIVEYNAPVKRIGNESGLMGIVLSTARVNGMLYVGTAAGLFWYDEPAARFRKIPGVTTQCWNIYPYGEPGAQTLVVGSTFAFFEVSGTRILWSDPGSYLSMTRHPSNPSLITAGQDNTIAFLEKQNGKWLKKQLEIPGDSYEYWTIHYDPEQNLWLGTDVFGLLSIPASILGDRMSSLPDQIEESRIVRYDTARGLPALERNFIFDLNHKLCIGTSNGVYQLDQSSGRFVRERHTLPFLDGVRVHQLFQASDGSIWYDSDTGKGSVRQVTGKNGARNWVRENRQLLRVPVSPNFIGSSSHISEFGNEIWYGNAEGLFFFDTRSKSTAGDTATVLIRSVEVNAEQVFMGEGNLPTLVLPHNRNQLNITFSTPSYAGIDFNRFTSRLEGFEDEWSGWTNVPSRNFNNLLPGDYRFEVKARNVYGTESSVAVFNFTIEPPWYLTYWAGGLYLVLFALVIFAAVRWRVALLEREKIALQTRIGLAVREIEERNRQLEDANRIIERNNLELEEAVQKRTEVLAEQNRQLEQFSFVTAHNLRSPVARILGLARLMVTAPAGMLQAMPEKLLQAANDLDNIIRDLGNILEARKGKNLQPVEMEVKPAFEAIVRSLEEGIRRGGVSVTLDTDLETMLTVPGYFNSVLYNLISNAVKYRRDSVKPFVRVTLKRKGEEYILLVEDNGLGFDSKRHAGRVFEPFQRFHSHGEGKGLGMFLVRNQVESLGGSIQLNSKVNEGTRVEVRLPVPPVVEVVPV